MTDTPAQSAPAPARPSAALLAAEQETAELVAFLRSRCATLNLEVRVRDAEIAELRALLADQVEGQLPPASEGDDSA